LSRKSYGFLIRSSAGEGHGRRSLRRATEKEIVPNLKKMHDKKLPGGYTIAAGLTVKKNKPRRFGENRHSDG